MKSKYVVVSRNSVSFVTALAAFKNLIVNSSVIAVGLADETAREIMVCHGNVGTVRAVLGHEFDVF